MCPSLRVEGEIGEKYFQVVDPFDGIFTFDVESFSFYNFLGAVKFFRNV